MVSQTGRPDVDHLAVGRTDETPGRYRAPVLSFGGSLTSSSSSQRTRSIAVRTAGSSGSSPSARIASHSSRPRLVRLLLRFYTERGRFPRGRGEIPDAAVDYVARQVAVGATEIAFYEWSGRTIESHRGRFARRWDFVRAASPTRKPWRIGWSRTSPNPNVAVSGA